MSRRSCRRGTETPPTGERGGARRRAGGRAAVLRHWLPLALGVVVVLAAFALELRQPRPDLRLAGWAACLLALIAGYQLAATTPGRHALAGVRRLLGRDATGSARVDAMLRRHGASGDRATRAALADALFDLAVELGRAGRVEEAIARYRECVDRFGRDGHAPTRFRVAHALLNLGVLLDWQDRHAEALDAYLEVERRAGSDPDPSVRRAVMQAMVNRAFTRGDLGDPEGGIADLVHAVERRRVIDPEMPTTELARRLPGLVQALPDLASRVAAGERLESTIGQPPGPGEEAVLAAVELCQGHALLAEGRLDDALAAWRATAARSDAVRELGIVAITAQLAIAKALKDAGRFAELLQACDEAHAAIDDHHGGEVRRAAAILALRRAEALAALDRADEAVAALDALAKRMGSARSANDRVYAATALERRTRLLWRLGRVEDCVASAERAARDFGRDEERRTRIQVLSGLSVAAEARRRAGRPADAMALLDRSIAMGSEPADARIGGLVEELRAERAEVLGELGRVDDGRVEAEGVVARAAAAPGRVDGGASLALPWAYLALGRIQRAAGDQDAAGLAFRAGLAAAEGAPRIAALAGAGLGVELGSLLADEGRHEEAAASYARVVERYAAEGGPMIQDHVAASRIGRGDALGRLGRTDEARAEYAAVVERHDGVRDVELAARASTARERLVALG